MSEDGSLRRVVLVPRGDDGRRAAGHPPVRRFALARVGVSPRSALGIDRHERLEAVADAEREPRPPGETPPGLFSTPV